MKKLLLIWFFTTLTICSYAQKRAIDKKLDPVVQFKTTVTKIETRFKPLPVVSTNQAFPNSPSGFVFYKMQFEILETRYDVQTTNSLVSPYIGYIVLKLRVKSNTESGDVASAGYTWGFSDSSKAAHNDNYGSCSHEGKDLKEGCVGEIKISYAYQEGRWIFKSIDTEVPQKIENGTMRFDIQRGVLNKLLSE